MPKYGDQGPFIPMPKGTYEADVADGTNRVKGYKGDAVWNSTWNGPNPPKTDNHYPWYGRVNDRK